MSDFDDDWDEPVPVANTNFDDEEEWNESEEEEEVKPVKAVKKVEEKKFSKDDLDSVTLKGKRDFELFGKAVAEKIISGTTGNTLQNIFECLKCFIEISANNLGPLQGQALRKELTQIYAKKKKRGKASKTVKKKKFVEKQTKVEKLNWGAKKKGYNRVAGMESLEDVDHDDFDFV